MFGIPLLMFLGVIFVGIPLLVIHWLTLPLTWLPWSIIIWNYCVLDPYDNDISDDEKIEHAFQILFFPPLCGGE